MCEFNKCISSQEKNQKENNNLKPSRGQYNPNDLFISRQRKPIRPFINVVACKIFL